jgi:hypothetical protein
MCVQIPFKEYCRAFWSLNNTLQNEFKNKEPIVVEKGEINFSLTEKGFRYTNFNNILKVIPEDIKSQDITLIFQTKKLDLEKDELPNCSLFSFVKEGKPKLCIDFEQCDDCFCINVMEQPMGSKMETIVPINTLTQDRWITHAFVYEYSRKQMRYYINATLACVIDQTVDMRMSDLYFNREHPCNGLIRNIGVYDCALTYNQIKKLLYHNYYKKWTTALWLKFIEFLYKDKKELIPWI